MLQKVKRIWLLLEIFIVILHWNTLIRAFILSFILLLLPIYCFVTHLGCDEALCNLFWSVMAPPYNVRELRSWIFLAVRMSGSCLLRWHLLLLGRDDEPVQIWTINLWTVSPCIEVVPTKSTPFMALVSLKSKYRAIKDWSGYFCKWWIDTNRKPMWHDRLVQSSAKNDRRYPLIDFFHSGRDKGFFRW